MKTLGAMQKYKWAYRLGCPAIKLLLLCLLLEIPGTNLRRPLQDKQWDWNWPNIHNLLIVVGIATLAYYAVQGSDPGFINEDMIRSTIESGTLLDDEESDIDVSTAREIEYRKKKIEAMEAQLAAENDLPDVSANVEEVEPAKKMAFCTVCNLEPPLRSYHCGYCNRCVATFDHHCFCIGTCIGEKNHCRFWWFLLFTSIEVYTCLGVIHSGFHSAPTIQDWLRTNCLAIVAVLFFWCFAFTAYSLLGFHSFLMLTNSTTRELGKGPEKLAYLHGTRECDLPFSNGALRNLGGFCCVRAGCWLRRWTPEQWKPVGKIERNSSNICDNMWENQYYSCC